MEAELLQIGPQQPLFPVAERPDGGATLCCCGIDCSSGACCCYMDTRELACQLADAAAPKPRQEPAGAGHHALHALADIAAHFAGSPQEAGLLAALAEAGLVASVPASKAAKPAAEQQQPGQETPPDVPAGELKQCTRCRRRLPKSAFCANQRAPDGLYTQCRACVAEKDRERRQRLKGQARAPAAAKSCARCRQRLPREAFYNDPARNDGLQTYCKQCFSAAYKERRGQKRGRQQEGVPQAPGLTAAPQ